jgi:hypothetical protein
MWTFLISGVVYLLGVAVVLFYKPSFMFSPDGNWKEFGIGQREDRYTPFPFWLFCISWAIVSYVLVAVSMSKGDSVQVPSVPKRNNRRRNQQAEIDYEDMYDFDDDVSELPKGYYVLNKKATRLSGIPKYVFLGANEPSSSNAESIS